MRKRMPIVLAFGAVMAASCGAPSADQAAAPLTPAGGCVVHAEAVWTPPGGKPLTLRAHADGPRCAGAVAVMTVRDADGAIAWTEAYDAGFVMVLAEAKTPEAMQAALAGWVSVDPAAAQTAAELPPWAPGAAAPEDREFGFYPADEMDQARYEALRATKAPMHCFVQGMESLACLAVTPESGVPELVGYQAFPG